MHPRAPRVTCGKPTLRVRDLPCGSSQTRHYHLQSTTVYLSLLIIDELRRDGTCPGAPLRNTPSHWLVVGSIAGEQRLEDGDVKDSTFSPQNVHEISGHGIMTWVWNNTDFTNRDARFFSFSFFFSAPGIFVLIWPATSTTSWADCLTPERRGGGGSERYRISPHEWPGLSYLCSCFMTVNSRSFCVRGDVGANGKI